MNSRTSFALLAVLTAVGTLTASAYAEELEIICIDCEVEDVREAARELLLEQVPVSVWTDKTDYSHSDKIMVEGQVANIGSGFPVTITVVSPLNSIIGADQIELSDDGTFGTTINTAGNIWKYDGTYIIKANYGSAENSAKIELSGGVPFVPDYDTPAEQCGENELAPSGHCVPYTITGGMVTGSVISGKSIVIYIDAEDDGILTVSPSKEVMDGIFMVLVDGQEWDDAEIDPNMATVMFPAGTEKIEIFATHVIPEFGAIAAMILAVAIVSIIAVSARSRLGIVPRY